jgi:hypothetical protein
MSIIGEWLELPVAPQFLLLAAFYLATAIIIHLLSFYGPTGRWCESFKGIVGPFFTSVTVIFSLLTGFVAGNIWRRGAEAAVAVRTEANALLNIYWLTPETTRDAATIRNLIRAYAESAIRQEWPLMHGAEGAPDTEALLGALLQQVLHRPDQGAITPSIDRARTDAALTLRTTRANRLSLSGDRTDELKWATILLLGVVAQLSIAVVHLEKRRPQIGALAIFSAAVVIALGLVALQERPFVQPIQVSTDPLDEVLRIVPAQ